MATKTIRTILALDGEQEFRNKLKQINSNLGVMKANVKALTAEYERNGGHAKTLGAQKDQLKQQITQLREKMTVLNQAVEKSKTAYDDAVKSYEKAVEEHGKESVEAHKAANAVTKAEQAYNNYRTQLINTNSELQSTEAELGKLNDKTGKFVEGLKKAGSALKEIGKGTTKATFEGLKLSLEGVGKLAEESAKGLAVYTSAAAGSAIGIGKYAAQVGMSFEEGMSGVEAIANATDEEMDALTERAKELGSSTKFTATEVSQGFNYMAMAGWEAEDMLKGIDGVINLAAASGEDLGLVSDMVTDSLTAFRMEAGDAGKYADILAQASSNANTNVAMMGETFQYCAPIAGAMGYQVDDLAVAVGLMANAGIKGSMAGTSLRSVITNLAAPTDAAYNAMQNLGISLTNEDGSMKSFEETVNQLRNGFAGLTEEEKAAAAKAIAGKPGMSGLLALVNASDQDYQSLRDSINDSAGAAERMAQIKLDNFAGDITILKSATEGLGLSIYDTFSVNLRDGVQELTDFVNQIHTAVDEGSDLSFAFKKIGEQIRSQLPAAFKNIGPKINAFLKSFNEVIVQVADIIIDALPEITSNVLPVLTERFTQLITRLIGRLPEFTKNVASAAAKMFTGLFTGLRNATNVLVSEMPVILGNLFGDPQTVAGLFNLGLNILVSLIKGITDNIGIVTKSMSELLPEIIKSFAEQIPTVISSAVDIIDALINAVDLGEVVSFAIIILEKLVEGINNNMDKISTIIPELVSGIVLAIAENAGDMARIAVALLVALAEALLLSIDRLLDKLPEINDEIKKKIKGEDWEEVGNDIWDKISVGLANAIKGTGKKAIHAHFKNDPYAKIAEDAVSGDSGREKLGLSLESLATFVGDLGLQKLSAGMTAVGSAINIQFGDVTIEDPETDIDLLVEMTQEAIRQKELAQGR